jgi:hypothetical protein
MLHGCVSVIFSVAYIILVFIFSVYILCAPTPYVNVLNHHTFTIYSKMVHYIHIFLQNRYVNYWKMVSVFQKIVQLSVS